MFLKKIKLTALIAALASTVTTKIFAKGNEQDSNRDKTKIEKEKVTVNPHVEKKEIDFGALDKFARVLSSDKACAAPPNGGGTRPPTELK